MIGTSKTFKQLARLAGFPAQRKGPFVRRSLTVADLETWIPQLAELHSRQRAKLPGISRPRSRQILAGAVTARAAMKALNVSSVDVCPWALREGIVLHYLQITHNESFDLPLRPLPGAAYQEGRQGPRSDRRIALVPHLVTLGDGPPAGAPRPARRPPTRTSGSIVSAGRTGQVAAPAVCRMSSLISCPRVQSGLSR